MHVHSKAGIPMEGAVGKGKLHRLWTAFLRHATAAVRTQAVWRGSRARKDIAAAAAAAAAVRIQAVWRGNRARKAIAAAAAASDGAPPASQATGRRSARLRPCSAQDSA